MLLEAGHNRPIFYSSTKWCGSDRHQRMASNAGRTDLPPAHACTACRATRHGWSKEPARSPWLRTAALPDGAGNLAGARIVYCAGCRLAVGDEMRKVSQAVAGSLGGMPFLGCFTFDEQGFMLERRLRAALENRRFTYVLQPKVDLRYCSTGIRHPRGRYVIPRR